MRMMAVNCLPVSLWNYINTEKETAHQVIEETTQGNVHLAHKLPPAVHTQVKVGLLPSNSHLAAEGVGLHYELGL